MDSVTRYPEMGAFHCIRFPSWRALVDICTNITPRQRAIANGQRSLGSFLLLCLSNTFLRILAVPNNAVFCSNPALMVIPSLSSHVSNLLLTAPRAPTTTGTTSCCLIPHSFPFSLFKSWYFSIFSPSFSYTLWSDGRAISTIITLLLSLSTTTMSGLQASITWSHWMFMSHNILHLSFSTTPSGWWSYHFSRLQSVQWTNLAILLCLLLYSFCARHMHSLIMWFIVSPFWPHILQSGDSTDLSMLNLIIFYSLFSVPVLGVQKYVLQFQPSNHHS